MRILVVEDDLMLADCLAEGLLDQGHVVCGIASTVAEAVLLARQHRPDAAILDMHLGNRERGSDIASQLAESGELADIGILYVTGEVEQAYRASCVGHACLNKPYKLSTLGIALEIVRDLAQAGDTAHPLPFGLQLLHPTNARPHHLSGDHATNSATPLWSSLGAGQPTLFPFF